MILFLLEYEAGCRNVFSVERQKAEAVSIELTERHPRVMLAQRIALLWLAGHNPSWGFLFVCFLHVIYIFIK